MALGVLLLFDAGLMAIGNVSLLVPCGQFLIVTE